MLRLLYRFFDVADRPLSWTFIVLGIVGAGASAIGWVAPIWLVGIIGFVLLGKQGYNDLKESVEEEVEGS